ncbi:hypothetical protein C356_04217 [Cryptococcus neoformans c45]|nr:hypothetical protein C356_04217 [Cryptococcus neoformans var. grubii c45]
MREQLRLLSGWIEESGIAVFVVHIGSCKSDSHYYLVEICYVCLVVSAGAVAAAMFSAIAVLNSKEYEQKQREEPERNASSRSRFLIDMTPHCSGIECTIAVTIVHITSMLLL